VQDIYTLDRSPRRFISMPVKKTESRMRINILRVLRLAVALAVLPSCGPAQEGQWGGELVSRIDSLAEARLREGPVAGFTIGVKRGADLLLTKGYGSADLEQGVAANAETVYRIGSLTKQLTAAAIMQLVESGQVDLNESITAYLPNYELQGHDVRVHHLLTHTSGILSYTELGDAFWLEASVHDLSHAEMRALFESEPFDFEPGAEYRYNNSAYYLLGVIIEVASGRTYDDYLDENILSPLGLTRSSYCHEQDIVPGRAQGYEQLNGALVNDGPISMNTPGAAGAMCSTVPDLLAWTVALRSGRVASGESYRAMTTSARLNDGSPAGYGFGLGVRPLATRARVSHGGGINGFSTFMAHYPDADLDIVILSNTSSTAPREMEQLIAEWALGIKER
jgi:D-alanyl-D-alanine carboxypeptidase